MKSKRLLLILLIALTVLFSFSMVSAGWFDFSNSEPALNETTLQCYDGSYEGHGSMVFRIFTKSPGNIQSHSGDITVQVNITDENNHTESFNISSWENDPIDKTVMKQSREMDYGTYNVSMYYPGSDIFNSSHLKKTVVIKPYEEPSVPNGTDDSTTDLDDGSDDNESTTYGYYKTEREEKTSSRSGSYGYWVYV